MLEEMSCWSVNWNAIGAVGSWVGGLGTAGAAWWAVVAARKAWNREKLRRKILVKTRAILVAPELLHVNSAAESLISEGDGILNDKNRLEYLKSRLTIKGAEELLRHNGEIEESLASAAAEFVVIVSVLQDSLDRWTSGPVRDEAARDAILRIAHLIPEKALKLTEEMSIVAVGSKALLREALSKGK